MNFGKFKQNQKTFCFIGFFHKIIAAAQMACVNIKRMSDTEIFDTPYYTYTIIQFFPPHTYTIIRQVIVVVCMYFQQDHKVR